MRKSIGEVSPVLISFLASSLWILVVKQSDRAMRRRGHQADYSARSSNHSSTRWNELIIDADFQTVCRDEGASSQRVLNICSIFVMCRNIWSRPWCYYKANKQAQFPIKEWPSSTVLHLLLWWLTYCSSWYSVIWSAEMTVELLNQWN